MKTSELRKKALETLAKRSQNYTEATADTIQRATKAMTSFYRLAGFSNRIFEIQNDERLYKRYSGRRLEAMEKRESDWIDRVRDYLKEFNADINYNGIYPSIIEKEKTPSGGVVDLMLTHWYE